MNADRASATARLIAAATVMRAGSREGGAAGPVGAAAWCERFLSTTRADRLLLWSARSALGRAWWRLAEAAVLPGIVAHWMRRKREVDRLARQAAMEGFQQLLVLGAGFDSLAFRLNDERLFDPILSADHPATLAVVRAATGSPGTPAQSAPGGNSPALVELLALDLAHDDVRSAITSTRNFDAQRATLVVIEGVLMYLSTIAVECVLRSIARFPNSRVRLIASSMVAEPGRPPGFRGQSRWVARWLRQRREPMLWAIPRAELPGFLADCGWSDIRLVDLTEQQPGDGADSSGLGSELLVVAERRQ